MGTEEQLMTIVEQAAKRLVHRRTVLSGLASAGLLAAVGWVGVSPRSKRPALVSAVRKSSGDYAVVALAGTGQMIWEFALPRRGHSVAPSPDGQYVAVFPRRPGQTIWLLETSNGRLVRTVDAHAGRQMNGHGVYSADGRTLYVTETVFGPMTTGEVTAYDVATGAIVNRFESGGLDPHQCVWCGDQLVIAHGGYIEYQDAARDKVLDSQRPPNLAWVDASTGRLQRADRLADPGLSIRHLAADEQGVFAGFQHDDGATANAPLMGYASSDQPLEPLEAPESTWSSFSGYVGSVAIDSVTEQVVATSPRGGVLGLWSRDTCAFRAIHRIADVCGAGVGEDGWIATTGFGVVTQAGETAYRTDYAFDNHLAALS